MANRFINAAKDGYVDILREGTRKDLNTPDEDGMTATLWAAHTGNLEALRLIVGREGDVNKADYQGMTAIHHAALRGHMNVVSYLVHWGCNVYALDNDLHSALDLAALYDRHEIVRFLDAHLGEKQAKNPKQVSKLKEEAMKAAENNIKRYEKLTDHAARKAEKEQRKLQLEMDLQLRQQNGTGSVDSKTKPGFFKSLTLRMKGIQNFSSNDDGSERRKSHVYSDAAGITSVGSKSGIAKKIQMKRLESLTPKSSTGVSDFKVSELDDSGNRTIRSINKGFVGSTSEVMYVAGDKGTTRGTLSVLKGDLFRAKSESELLDSGTDTYYGEDEDDSNSGGMFNRPEFGKLAFLPKSPFLNTLQSFDDDLPSTSQKNANSDSQHLSGDTNDLIDSKSPNGLPPRQSLPWDQDDLGNLDDDEDDAEVSELSAVNMFLWSCGLASYLHIFLQEKIDMQVLTAMTDSELKELGLPFGPRKKLKDAIDKRKTVLETPSRMVDTHL